MSDGNYLSDRVRDNIEAAPWVRQEIIAIEASLDGALAEIEALRAEVAKLRSENTTLRALVAAQPTPCVYCGLTEMSKCASGFPGCARADDLICGEEEAFKAVVSERNTLRAEVARLTAALNGKENSDA